jgi:dihydrofolate reductase
MAGGRGRRVYVTLDEVCEDPGWSGPYWSDEAQLFARDQLWASDALLMGRKIRALRRELADRGVDRARGDFAERMNRLPKHVASPALKEPLEWSNSVLLKGDIAEAMGQLKQEPDQDLLMYSNVELMHTLMPHGLIDEDRIWVHPLILGGGRRLFEDEIDKTELNLVDTTTLPHGVVVLAYRQAT